MYFVYISLKVPVSSTLDLCGISIDPYNNDYQCTNIRDEVLYFAVLLDHCSTDIYSISQYIVFSIRLYFNHLAQNIDYFPILRKILINIIYMAGHLIFGWSSRGAKLEYFLEQRIPIDDWYYHIIVKPGGTIKQIHNEINNSMDSIQEMYGTDTKMKVVFTWGLCNFTQKITHDFGTETKYQNDPKANKVNSVISQLQDIQNEIYKSKNTPIAFACIPPVCISKYLDYNYNSFDLTKNRYKLQKSIFSDLETEIQQKNLEKDLHLTNEKICELNNAIGVSNIRRDKSVCKKRGRMGTNKSVVCVYNYEGFYDGVHPNLPMADKWFADMCSSVLHDLRNGMVFEDSDSNDDEDSWNFK